MQIASPNCIACAISENVHDFFLREHRTTAAGVMSAYCAILPSVSAITAPRSPMGRGGPVVESHLV